MEARAGESRAKVENSVAHAAPAFPETKPPDLSAAHSWLARAFAQIRARAASARRDRFCPRAGARRAIATATMRACGPERPLARSDLRFARRVGAIGTCEINGSRSSGARVSSERHRLRVGRSLLAHCGSWDGQPPPVRARRRRAYAGLAQRSGAGLLLLLNLSSATRSLAAPAWRRRSSDASVLLLVLYALIVAHGELCCFLEPAYIAPPARLDSVAGRASRCCSPKQTRPAGLP